jgi:Beta-lactamase enzyme family
MPHECPAVPGVDLTTPVFPPAYPNVIQANDGLQKLLTKAMEAAHAKEPTLKNIGLTLVALDKAGAHPMAHQRGDLMFFGASMMKVAALYGLFELRTTLRALAKELDCNATQEELVEACKWHLDTQVVQYLPKLPALAGAPHKYLLPKYATTFKVVPAADNKISVDFADRFAMGPSNGGGLTGSIERMMTISDNTDAARCIQACGYGYLNGALASGGHLDPRTGTKAKGVWLAGDFLQSKAFPKYKAYYVQAEGDPAAQGTTASHLARLLANLFDGNLFGKQRDARKGMLEAMYKAAAYPEVWINRGPTPHKFKVTHNKLGVASGLLSECSFVEHLASKKRFVLVWLNLRWTTEKAFDVLHQAVGTAMDEYVK